LVASADWLFFDCFNTLLTDSDPDGTHYGFCGVWPVAVAMGLAQSDDELHARYRAWRLMRRNADDAWREADLEERLRGVFGADLDRPGIRERLVMTWQRGFPLQTGLEPGVAAMLIHWKKQGKRLAVVSNFYVAGYPRELLERRCLLPYLDLVIDSAELGIKKPDPRIYHATCERAGTTPDRVVFLGDTYANDVETPRALGMQALWYRAGEGALPDAPEPPLRHWNAFR
jgi:putative hydrolase of the HAD superfamily